jgi:hypothetical protein
LLNVSFIDTVNDSIMCIISWNCLELTKASSSSSGPAAVVVSWEAWLVE